MPRHALLIPLAVPLALSLACSTREPSSTEAQRQPEPKPDRGPLVTVELRLVEDAPREQLAARLGPTSEVAQSNLLLAVHHRIEPGWHIYWKNPGESGLRTQLDVTTNQAKAGTVLFPGPDRFEAAGAVTYGWGHEAVLFVPLDDVADAATLEIHSRYLACAESCIPGEAKLEAVITKLPRRTDPLTQAMLDRVPEPAGDRITSTWQDGALQLQPTTETVTLTELYPYASDTALLGRQVPKAGGLELHYRFTGSPPTDAQGVLLASVDGKPRWLELSVPWP